MTTTGTPPHDTAPREPATPAPGGGGRLARWAGPLRGHLRRWYAAILLVNLVAEVGIIVTGGLVRVTGSGLGCPSWPQCTPGHFTPVAHQAQGYHKYIEFGNRTLTGILVVAAVMAFLAVMTVARRRALVVAASLVLAGVPIQAIIGGISVLTSLAPITISLHFLTSAAMVAASAYLYLARDEAGGPAHPVGPPLLRRVGVLTSVMAVLVLTLGTVVTGSGPHSGDADAPSRYGLDPRSVSWLHADAVMLFAGLAVAMWLGVRLADTTPRARRAWTGVIHVIVLQAVVGYVQYFTGLPTWLVVVHMLLAALLVVALTRAMMTLRHRGPEPTRGA